MPAAPDIRHGKEFERACNAAFSKLYMRFPIRWERVLDTGAAGNLVRKADSDYRILQRSDIEGQPFMTYVECKASVQGKDFRNIFRSLVKGEQNASLQMARRAGAQACVFYKDIQYGVIEVWRGRDINEQYPIARKPMLADPAFRFSADMLFDFAELVAQNPWAFHSALRDTGVQQFPRNV